MARVLFVFFLEGFFDGKPESLQSVGRAEPGGVDGQVQARLVEPGPTDTDRAAVVTYHTRSKGAPDDGVDPALGEGVLGFGTDTDDRGGFVGDVVTWHFWTRLGCFWLVVGVSWSRAGWSMSDFSVIDKFYFQ